MLHVPPTLFEPVNLMRHVLDEGGLGHLLVHLRLVLDVLGTLGIVQRTQRLLQAVRIGGHGGNDARLGAAPQGVTQQAGKLAVAIGDVPQVLHQRGDNAAQRQQALVDQASLLGTALHTRDSAGKPHCKKEEQVTMFMQT